MCGRSGYDTVKLRHRVVLWVVANFIDQHVTFVSVVEMSTARQWSGCVEELHEKMVIRAHERGDSIQCASSRDSGQARVGGDSSNAAENIGRLCRLISLYT